MTPDAEREAQYADELVAALPQDARECLQQDWAQYLVDREQRDLSGRHRDFILGWVACYDSYGLRPRLVRVTFKDPEATPRPRPAARRSTLYERAMEAQKQEVALGSGPNVAGPAQRTDRNKHADLTGPA